MKFSLLASIQEAPYLSTLTALCLPLEISSTTGEQPTRVVVFKPLGAEDKND